MSSEIREDPRDTPYAVAIAVAFVAAVAFVIATAMACLVLVSAAAAEPTMSEAEALAADREAIAADAAYKAAHDTAPKGELSPFQKKMMRQKDQEIADLLSAATGRPITLGETTTNADGQVLASAAPAEWACMYSQHPQQQKNWCGPATLQEALEQCYHGITQRQAAIESGASLNPERPGTPWYVSQHVGYPVPNVMNKHQDHNYYVPVGVSCVPTEADIAIFKTRLVTTLWNTYAPLIGDAYTTQESRYHLVGHPTDRTILHWFDIYGYSDSGEFTYYEDSVHAAKCVKWYKKVPAFSSMPSYKIVTICGGRGYCY